MHEGEITHTIIMTFKDVTGCARSIKVPFARPKVSRQEVRHVMELIVRLKAFLSRNGLPLITMVKARLVTIRVIFLAHNLSRQSRKKAAAPVTISAAATTATTPSVWTLKTANGISYTCINQLMRQAPAAPAFCNSGHFSGLIPPMAYTGIGLFRQIVCNAVTPLAGSPGLQSVA